MYLGVAYITYATQGFYVYNFLNPGIEHAKLAAYIVGILVGCIIIFAIVNFVAGTLKRVTTAKLYERWRERYEMNQREDNLESGKISNTSY